MTTTKRLKTKFHLFYEALTLKEIRNLLIFFFIVSLCAPNLEEFLIYYNEMMLVTPLYEGYAMIVLFITGAAIFLIYNNSVMSKSEVHNTQYVAIVMRVISALFFAYDVAGKYPAGRTLMI
jgi:Na+/melibiose symporter-like transporter